MSVRVGYSNTTCLSPPACQSSSYLFAAWGAHALRTFARRGEYAVELHVADADARSSVELNGISVFRTPSGILSILRDLAKSLHLLFGRHQEHDMRSFLEEMAGFSYDERPMPIGDWKASISPDDFVDGDCVLSWNTHSGPDALQMWATGSRITHSQMVLTIGGVKYVIEMTAPVARRTELSEWIAGIDSGSPRVFARLSPKSRAMFNSTAAAERFAQLEGLEYGYQNYLFGWLDNVRGNFPPPLSSDAAMVAVAIADRLAHSQIERMAGEALNQRLGRSGCCPVRARNCTGPRCWTIDEIYRELARRGMSFAELLEMPERDEWRYWNGPARVCDTFVVDILQSAGVLARDIEASEMVPRDSYQLAIYDPQEPELCSKIPNADAVGSPSRRDGYCQITGNWVLTLPGVCGRPARRYSATHMY
eukprot:m51a1_g5139 hypothetical protein (422) ;mRNA; r:17715-19402